MVGVRGGVGGEKDAPLCPKREKRFEIGRGQHSEFQPGEGKEVRVLLAQSPCAMCFERPKLKPTEAGVRKGLLI